MLMLTTIEAVQAMPGFNNTVRYPLPWMNLLIGQVSQAIRTYLKRDIELTPYVEYYSGNLTPNVVCRQWPVLLGQTTVSSSSDGVSLPTSTINVSSTSGFNPGTGGNPDADPPYIAVQTGVSTWSAVTYTGTTETSFTGCSGGIGTLSSSDNENKVASPVVWVDGNGSFGQKPGAFADGTILSPGTTWVLDIDRGTTSRRGLIRRIGGQGFWYPGFYPENMFSGKLAAARLPVWPRGYGNIKVAYNAGYTQEDIPYDIRYVAAMMVAYFTRAQPAGAPLATEGLGGYTYSILSGNNDIPELSSVPRLLAPYREISW